MGSQTAIPARLRQTRWPFVVFAAALFTLLLGGNLPTPLYAVYRQQFGFSNVVLALVFATYAIVLIPSLLLFGQLSDRLGRRRVVALGLGAAVLGSVLFAFAQSVAWLFVARGVQGAALGATAGTAVAALVELEPAADAGRAAMGAVLGQAGGAAVGPVLAGVLAEWAPAPRVLPYLVGLTVTAVVGVAVLRAPEPSVPSGSWRLQWPSVPAISRGRFARAGLTGAAVWAVGALYLSVVPTYASQLLGTRNLALLGAITSCMLGVACVAQAFAVRSRLTPGRSQLAALGLLVAGLAALVAAFPAHALALVLLAALLSGLGVGLGYFGSQADVNQLAPAERRGEVTAAFITCIYTGVAVASITVGLLSNVLSLFGAVMVTASVIAATAAATAIWHLSSAR
jgi:MFS family permease